MRREMVKIYKDIGSGRYTWKFNGLKGKLLFKDPSEAIEYFKKRMRPILIMSKETVKFNIVDLNHTTDGTNEDNER